MIACLVRGPRRQRLAIDPLTRRSSANCCPDIGERGKAVWREFAQHNSKFALPFDRVDFDAARKDLRVSTDTRSRPNSAGSGTIIGGDKEQDNWFTPKCPNIKLASHHAPQPLLGLFHKAESCIQYYHFFLCAELSWHTTSQESKLLFEKIGQRGTDLGRHN
jgi:hypothetical protein